MVSSDERMDALVNSIGKLSVAVESLRVRMDSVESILNTRTDTIRKMYDYIQVSNERLTKIEACAAAQERIWSKFVPFISILFGVGISMVGYVLLHVYGGK